MHGGENPVLLQGCGSLCNAAPPAWAAGGSGQGQTSGFTRWLYRPGHVASLCIKSARSLAVGQKCSPGLREHSPVPAVCCHGRDTCSPLLAPWWGRAQLRNLGGVSVRRAMPRASCTRSLMKSIKMRINGTSSVMDLTTP